MKNSAVPRSRGLALGRALVVTLMVAAVTACGGGGGDAAGGGDDGEARRAGLYFSYPADGQTDVAPRAPLVLAFLDKVDLMASDFTLAGPEGDVEFDLRSVNGGTGVVVTPRQSLALKSDYQLTLKGDGEVSLPGGGLNFTTRPALEGPMVSRGTSDVFQVSTLSPDGVDLPFLDFSSLTLTLTQPVDADTVTLGETVTLTQNGEPVAAALLVDGRHLTIDPDNAEGNPALNHDLEPGVPVTVTLTEGIKNRRGEPLERFSKTLIPQDTAPRSVLANQAKPASDSGDCFAMDAARSPLTGDPINCIPVNARLLGFDKTVSELQGDIRAELAYVVNFPRVTPLRISRDSLLRGNALDVLIGGEVNAGFDSGDVTVRFLSDANGYLMDNPYTDDPAAPRRLVLSMDVAFQTEDPRANGAFNQKLLHVQLVGTAMVDTRKGSLIANAVGVVEPRVIGSEDAYGLLSFRMESYPDQAAAPERLKDITGPELTTWMPGDRVGKQRPGDPIILSFSEPLDGATVVPGETLTLTADGATVPFRWYFDGVDLVLQPSAPLAFGATYEVSYTDGLTDLAGNGAYPATRTFALPVYEDRPADGEDAGNQRSPLALTTYPGFPCIPTDFDLASGDAGRCLGGDEEDDHLPLSRLPKDRDITVTFSQVMDPASANDDTFVVERVDASGAVLGTVDGDIEVRGQTLTFTPLQPWRVGDYYRYTLKSVLTGAVCGRDALCDERGLPLQTKPLSQDARKGDLPNGTDVEDADVAPEVTEGGPDLPVYFQATEQADGVLQHLRNLPTADVNANFLRDDSETRVSESEDALRNSVRILRDPQANEDADGTSANGISVTDANVGCEFVTDDQGEYVMDDEGLPVPQSCPDDKYSSITGNLDVEVVGYKTPQDVARMVEQEKARSADGATTTIPETVQQNGGVLVYIYPTQLVVSNVTVYFVPSALIASIGSVEPAPTGPQLMRIRYTCEPGSATAPCESPDHGRVKGWIVEGGEGPRFVTDLNLYLDAPQLAPVSIILGDELTLGHKLHSYDLNLKLAGAVTFLPDGRLQIEQISQNDLHIQVSLTGLAEVFVKIPAGETVLNYVSTPIKN